MQKYCRDQQKEGHDDLLDIGPRRWNTSGQLLLSVSWTGRITPPGKPPPLAVRLEEGSAVPACDRRSPFNEPGSSKKEIDMREWKSQSHVKWYCKYHIVFSPKYRKKAMFGSLRKGVGKILRELSNQSE